MNFLKQKRLLFVLIFIAAIASIIWSTHTYFNDERIREYGTISKMKAVRAELQRYKEKCKHFPKSLSELVSISGCATNSNLSHDDLLDRWGNTLVYASDGEKYRLLSIGNEWIDSSETTDPAVTKKPH